MHIHWIEIENYKSFWQKVHVDFHPGMNLIVGNNNAGKSALLEAIAGPNRLRPHPHLSQAARPHPDDPIDQWSRVLICIGLRGTELRRAMLTINAPQLYGWPASVPFDGNRSAEALTAIFSSNQLNVQMQFAVTEGGGQWRAVDSQNCLRGYDHLHANGNPLYLVAEPNPQRTGFQFREAQVGAGNWPEE